MSNDTSIAWTHPPLYRGKNGNFVDGCLRRDSGCVHCYAERIARRFSSPGQPYEGLIGDAGRWNGGLKLSPEKLAMMLGWSKALRFVFVNTMSDLFLGATPAEERVPDDLIAAAWGVMMAIRRVRPHIFSILTKREERLRAFLTWMNDSPNPPQFAAGVALDLLGDHLKPAWRSRLEALYTARDHPWPDPGIWAGVSCSDQRSWDARVPVLRETPGLAVRMISLEPLVERVEIKPYDLRDIGWLIVGGESGHRARPMEATWAKIACDAAQERGVPLFYKQNGAWLTEQLTGERHAGEDPTSHPAWAQGLRAWPTSGRLLKETP